MRVLSNAQTQALAGVYGREAVFRRTESGGFRLDFDRPLGARLEQVRAQIGDELYERLTSWNDQDLALYDYVCERLT